MSLEKKFIKTRAFKNLMASMCEASAHVGLALLPYAAGILSVGSFYLGLNLHGLFLGGTQVLAAIQLAGGMEYLMEKFSIPKKTYIAMQMQKKREKKEVEAKNAETQKILSAMTELSTSQNSNERSELYYQMIATLRVIEKTDQMDLKKWQHGLDHYENQALVEVESLFKKVNEISQSMDSQKLHTLESKILKTKLKSDNFKLKNGLGLIEVSRLSPNGKTYDDFYTESAFNPPLFEKAQYLIEHGVIESLVKTDYEAIGLIFKHCKEHVIARTIAFLIDNLSIVDWSQIKKDFKKNFKGKAGFFRKYYADLTHLEMQCHASYVQRQLEIQAQTAITEKPHIIDHDSQHSTQSIKRCEYIDHDPLFFVDKWAELQNHYNFLMLNGDKIERSDLLELHQTLNTYLPVMIMTEASLKNNFQIQSEATKSLLKDNLNLMLTQVKTLTERLGHDLLRELRIAKKHQAMKMNQ